MEKKSLEKTHVVHRGAVTNFMIMEARVVTSRHSLAALLDLLRVCKLPYRDIRLENNLFVSYHDEAAESLVLADWNFIHPSRCFDRLQ